MATASIYTVEAMDVNAIAHHWITLGGHGTSAAAQDAMWAARGLFPDLPLRVVEVFLTTKRLVVCNDPRREG